MSLPQHKNIANEATVSISSHIGTNAGMDHKGLQIPDLSVGQGGLLIPLGALHDILNRIHHSLLGKPDISLVNLFPVAPTANAPVTAMIARAEGDGDFHLTTHAAIKDEAKVGSHSLEVVKVRANLVAVLVVSQPCVVLIDQLQEDRLLVMALVKKISKARLKGGTPNKIKSESELVFCAFRFPLDMLACNGLTPE